MGRVAEKYTASTEVSVVAMADMFTSSVEGGIILSRIFMSNQALVEQVMLYREFLRLAFPVANAQQ